VVLAAYTICMEGQRGGKDASMLISRTGDQVCTA
jgi:hypothetical protein